MSLSEALPSKIPDLIGSFNELLLNASGNVDTLNKVSELLSDELERASNSSCKSDDDENRHESIKSPITEAETCSDASTLDLTRLVTHVRQFAPPSILREHNILNEVESLYSEEHFKRKYIWLSTSHEPLQWAGRSYNPLDINKCSGISGFMKKINSENNLELNSCLLVRYSADDHGVGLHQDNEPIIDNTHPMVITSLGSTRSIEFWDSKYESTGKLIKQVEPIEGDLVIMEVGCQSMLWHKVLRRHGTSSDNSGIRYALTFRKTLHEKSCLKPLSNGFFVHSDRLPPPSAPPLSPPPNASPSAPPLSLLPNTPPSHFTPEPLNNESTNAPSPPSHLVIGDSMVNGLRIPGSVLIHKGGIRPNEVLQLLPCCTDILNPNDYDCIKTVTLVVGTNALNVTRPNKGIALLDVVEDYENLILALRKLFPNAKLGLYNVLPRAYTCYETVKRIQIFNDIFDQHVVNRLSNVTWIRHYWEFIDQWGFLRQDLYGKRGVHLKGKGKSLMASKIKNFQR